MRAVAAGDADIASVDAISYHHIVESDPMLASAVRVMGQSVHTTGLPFIMHNNEQMDRSALVDALNQCVEQLSDTYREHLKLIRFSEVSETDYEALIRLETEAVATGYPTLS
jgi:ABC-type phosphate/phosphonate transport system substrate-binding protein